MRGICNLAADVATCQGYILTPNPNSAEAKSKQEQAASQSLNWTATEKNRPAPLPAGTPTKTTQKPQLLALVASLSLQEALPYMYARTHGPRRH